jgi:hypothetical protein
VPLPPGLNLIAYAAAQSTPPAVTFPAMPGVTWVLTSATWSAYQAGASAAADPVPDVTSAGVSLYQTDMLINFAQTPNAGDYEGNTATATGLYQGVVDSSLIVTYVTWNVNLFGRISATAYPM